MTEFVKIKVVYMASNQIDNYGPESTRFFTFYDSKDEKNWQGRHDIEKNTWVGRVTGTTDLFFWPYPT